MTAEPFALLASCWTSAGDVRPGITPDESPHALETRIDAIAAAGYRGAGFELADLRRLETPQQRRDIRARLEDAGIETLEIEIIDDWHAPPGPARRASDARRRELLGLAEALGAHHIKIGGGSSALPADLDRIQEEFDRLADEAVERGTVLGLEAGAFSTIPQLDAAARLVRESGSAGAGILLDVWHLQRTGFDYDRLPEIIPAERLVAVELDDGARECEGTLLDDTLDRRRYCGEGDFDVVRFIRAIDAVGYEGAWGVEHMSEEHRTLSIDAALRAARDAAVKTLAEALG